MGKIFKNYARRSSSLKTNWQIKSFTETYSEPCQTSEKVLLTKIVISFSFFVKSSILRCLKGFRIHLCFMDIFHMQKILTYRLWNHVPQTACVIKMIIVKWGGTNLSKISVNEGQSLAAWTIIFFFSFEYLFRHFESGNITRPESKLKE